MAPQRGDIVGTIIGVKTSLNRWLNTELILSDQAKMQAGLLVTDNNKEAQERPCVILRVHSNGTFTVCLMTTFGSGRSPIRGDVNIHFAIAIAETSRQQTTSNLVLHTVPEWPRSPQYLIAVPGHIDSPVRPWHPNVRFYMPEQELARLEAEILYKRSLWPSVYANLLAMPTDPPSGLRSQPGPHNMLPYPQFPHTTYLPQPILSRQPAYPSQLSYIRYPQNNQDDSSPVVPGSNAVGYPPQGPWP